MEKSVEAGTRGGVANGNPLRAGTCVDRILHRVSSRAQEDSPMQGEPILVRPAHALARRKGTAPD